MMQKKIHKNKNLNNLIKEVHQIVGLFQEILRLINFQLLYLNLI